MSCYIKAPIIFPHYIRSPEHEQNKMNETYFGSSSFLNLLHLIPKKTLEKKLFALSLGDWSQYFQYRISIRNHCWW